MKLHYFNPENDIALGLAEGQCLTMSPIVSSLHDSGALLPLWYASPGDSVLVEKGYDADFVTKMCRDFAINDVSVAEFMGGGSPLCRGLVPSDRWGRSICIDGEVEGAPWGWSYEAAHRLHDAGASTPDGDRLIALRKLSHRRTTIEVLSRLSERVGFALPPSPVEVSDVSALGRCIDEWGSVYVKQPWSSSGRGVFRIDRLTTQLTSRVSGMIRRQGSVLVEAAFDKSADFAMLFRSLSGRTELAGYSLFFNLGRDSYGGNLMASDEAIEDYLVALGARRHYLEELKRCLPEILSEMVSPVYDGYFGIDMMVGVDGSISPCVEVNLRMTMGVVAHIWRERYLYPGVNGVFRVEAVSLSEGETSAYEVKNNRMQKGRVLLTPPSAYGFIFSVETVDGIDIRI